MTADTVLRLFLRSQRLAADEDGYAVWRCQTEQRLVSAERLALILCDVWDHHWCRGAEERLALMLPRMNAIVRAVRARGATIIHAPSDTMPFCEHHPARQRALAIPLADPPSELAHDDPPLPIDDSDQGCDTAGGQPQRVWTRQHAAIAIDHQKDYITDNGRCAHAILRQRAIEQTLIMGVHTNMCILRRSFAIKQMVRWGVGIALIRDLTDAMYNPARSPYVSHEQGTALVIGYIEKFWCPTVASADLLA